MGNERAPNCDRVGQTKEERTHTGPDADSLCLKCRRWVVTVKCFDCQKPFLRLRNDRDKWLCPECADEAGI